MSIVSNTQLTALRTGMQASFDQTYAKYEPKSFHGDVATEIISDDAMETYGWLSDFPDMIEWVGPRTVKSMKENVYQIPNKDWESTVSVQRPTIMDDKFGTLTPRIRHMAQAAAQHPETLIANIMRQGHALLCYDGQNYFDTDHPVFPNVDGTGVALTQSNYFEGTGPAWYLLSTSMPLKPFIFQRRMKPEFEQLTATSGGGPAFFDNAYHFGIYARHNVGFGFWQCAIKSTEALTTENLEKAEKAMMEFQKDGLNPMGIMPDLLVVPPALKAAGRRLVQTRTESGGGDNPLYDAFKLLTVPWLAQVGA
ncbi:MAG: Mu-like prophage major head subunit gpT family protein [Pseudomonadota bacterium]